MDFVMSYEVAKALYNRLGSNGFLRILQLRFPNLGLYTFSSSWIEDRHYICKAKGTTGDLVVSWFDMQQIEQAYLSQINELSQAGELSQVAHILQPFEFLGWFERHSPVYDQIVDPEKYGVPGRV